MGAALALEPAALALSPAERADARRGQLAMHGMPVVVWQAIRDRRLSPTARLLMFYLAEALDFVEWTELARDAIAKASGFGDANASRALRQLEAHGYLLARRRKGHAKEYRLPWSRRPVLAGAERDRRTVPRGRAFERRTPREIHIVRVAPDPTNGANGSV